MCASSDITQSCSRVKFFVNDACGISTAARRPESGRFSALPARGNEPPARSGTFTDLESDDGAYWNVRSFPLGVAVGLTLASGGDIDVVMDQRTAREFANAVLWAIDPTSD